MSIKKHLFTAIAFCGISQAYAQNDTSFLHNQLEEVVFTATKFAKKNNETGKVVTIISNLDLERSMGKDLSQVLNEQAGIIINSSNSNPGKDKSIFIRGAKNDYTVILVNGIPLTDASGVGGAFDLRLFPIEQIERIEILKGAQSTLYGSDAIAGVINIITKSGAKTPASIYGNVAGGSYGTFKAHAGVSGSTDLLRYNIGFTHHETVGVSEAADTTTAKSFDKDGSLQNALNVSIEAEVVKNFTVKPFFRYSYLRGNSDGGSYIDGPETYKTTLLSSGVHFRYKLSKGAVNAIFNFDEAFRDYKNAFPADPYKGRSKTIDVYGNFDLSEMFQLLAGVDYRHQKSIDENATPKNPTMNMVSPYASLHLRNAGGFFMEVGTRYNHHSKFGSHTTFSVNPGYTLNSNVKVFANISSAFKAPALSSLYGQWGANPDLKPERSSTFEGGVQASLLANRFNFRAVGFARNTKDVIIYGPSFTMINLDDQKDHGFEIEPTVKFNEKIRLALHYAYVNGEVHTVKEGKDTSYANLIRKPKHSTGFTGSYQITPRLFFSTSVFTYSSRTDVDFNSFPSEEVTMKGYAVWNAFAEYGLFSNKLKLFFDVKNITNTKYEEVWGYSALGVNFMGGLSVKF